jgi:hypothetical protein
VEDSASKEVEVPTFRNSEPECGYEDDALDLMMTLA